MTSMSALAQLQLEMINRARMDPAAEAARIGIDLNAFIAPGTISADPKQVLAGNDKLSAAAEAHTAFMFQVNQMAHSGIGDGDPSSRITAQGYAPNRWAENIGQSLPTTGPVSQATLALLGAGANDALFKDDPAWNKGTPGGHRLNILNAEVKEVGIGAAIGTFQGETRVLTTQNFGTSGTQSFLTGAVYNDTVVSDNFYSLGEGVSGTKVQVFNMSGGFVGQDTTGAGGGWSVGQPGGTYKVTFTQGGKDVSAVIEAGVLNAKMDLVNGADIYANANTTLSTGAAGLRLLGIQSINGTGNDGANVIVGNSANNIIDGKGGNDIIDGGNGIDTVVFSGNQSNYKITLLAGGGATIQDLRGIDGTDTVKNVEFVDFADKKHVAFADLQTTPAPKAGSVTIGDMSIEEGNSGTKTVTFTVTRTGGDAAFSVKYATQDDSAKAGSDYVAKTDTLNFGVGEMKKTFTIVINGDTVVESPEKFFVNLSNATNGATIADSQAVGTILNDDVAAPVNTAPVVTGKNVAVDTHGSVAISSLFTATDKDGNGTIKQYAFWDSGDSDGFISVNGVAQGSDKWIFVNATDLANVKYVGGAATGAEKIFVTAFDGTAWSANASLTATTTARAEHDFGGDGKSDLLLVNSKTGSVAMWQMDGNKIVANTTVGSIATTWKAIGTDDFGGDGKSDVLWQNSNGSVAMWQMDGTKIVSNTTVGTIGSNWKAAAVDDFNGDGKADVLWTSNTGSVALWQMDGSKIAANQSVGTLGANWLVQDAADFNGDGKADILLRNNVTGNVAMWQMDGNKIVANESVGTIGTAWKFAGAADFNGDGHDDILWRNDNGSVAMWQMDGNKILANETVGTIGSNWKLSDIGDFNNDGKADIMWQNDKGAVAEWQMNGSQIAANVSVGSAATDWHIV